VSSRGLSGVLFFYFLIPASNSTLATVFDGYDDSFFFFKSGFPFIFYFFLK
jgi:hypothetical protein